MKSMEYFDYCRIMPYGRLIHVMNDGWSVDGEILVVRLALNDVCYAKKGLTLCHMFGNVSGRQKYTAPQLLDNSSPYTFNPLGTALT